MKTYLSSTSRGKEGILQHCLKNTFLKNQLSHFESLMMITGALVRPVAGTACTDASTSQPDLLAQQPAKEARDTIRHATQQAKKNKQPAVSVVHATNQKTRLTFSSLSLPRACNSNRSNQEKYTFLRLFEKKTASR